MADLLRIAVVVVAATASTAALLTTVVYFLPRPTVRAQGALEETPGRCFLIGLVNLLFFGLLAAVLGQGGDLLRLISFMILLALLTVGGVGLSGLLILLRQRIYGLEETETALLGKNLRTAVLLSIACLAPVAGWFVLAPILVIMGVGSGILALVRRRITIAVSSQTRDN